MRVALSVCALLALTACGRSAPAGYPPGVERNFMQACEAQSTSPGLCACTWDRIEADIDPNDFAALERLPGPERQAHPLTQQIADMALACHASLAPLPDDAEPAPAP